VTGVVQLADGAANYGSISKVFTLGVPQFTTVTQVFSSVGVITIRDANTALPYPSTINVSGVTNQIVKLTASLNSLTHTYVEDVFVLLAAPNGQRTTLMTYTSQNPVTGLNLTFDDAAASPVPYLGVIPSGTYLPTDYAYGTFGPYIFPSPAPPDPYGVTMASLAPSPNGGWSLYVYDFASSDAGTLSSWTLRFVTLQTNSLCCSTLPDPTVPTYTSTTWSNGVVRLNWQAVPGPNYQVQFRTNLTVGSWQNLGSPIPGTNTTLGITDSVPGVPTRIYRVLVSP
jgi:subtilisin-like proprotein convertase family protein